MTLSLWIVCFWGLLHITTSRDGKCYKCHHAPSIDDCTVQDCESGPECNFEITRGRDGMLYSGACATVADCKERIQFPERHHHFSTVCSGCCFDKDMCVPRECDPFVLTAAQTPKPTEPLSFRLTKGVTCEVCDGGTCGIYPGQDPVLQCPDHLPYCMNIMQNEADGNKRFTKLCASENDCDSFWWNMTSQRTECQNFDPSNIYDSTFECNYCCVTPGCNRYIHPADNTLYIGR